MHVGRIVECGTTFYFFGRFFFVSPPPPPRSAGEDWFGSLFARLGLQPVGRLVMSWFSLIG